MSAQTLCTPLPSLTTPSTFLPPRSVNRDAVPFSEDDIYRHNPWRAPGSAPVSDACGLAGGTFLRTNGSEAGDFVTTKFARHGDVGTKTLLPLPGYTPPVYKQGGTAEVVWSMRNNHGGGYQYRLCKLDEDGDLSKVTEACFQRTPLEFVRDQQSIVFPNGTQQLLHASQTTFVDNGTLPAGSTWSLIPMPPTLLGPCCIPGDHDSWLTPHHCTKEDKKHGKGCGVKEGQATGTCSPCPQSPGSDCSRCDQVKEVLPGRYRRAKPFPPPCPTCQGVDWNGYSVRDVLTIPADLAPGKYIMGFRYDCEATAQVWSNCAVSFFQSCTYPCSATPSSFSR